MTLGRTLIVDNYDSFTYNLAHLLEALLDQKVDVLRPEQVTTAAFDRAERVVFSPGPGLPGEHPRLLHWVRRALDLNKTTLGVCLGFQALAQVTGGTLHNMSEVCHGVAHVVDIRHGSSLFTGLPNPMAVGRYHSWGVDAGSLPDDWRIDARDSLGQVMAISHVQKPVFGVQFHPESILTPEGKGLLKNFLEVVKTPVGAV